MFHAFSGSGPVVNRWPRRLAVMAFLLAFLLVPPAQAQDGRSFIWSVSDGGGPRLYLLGSVHMARPDLYPLPLVMEEAFAASDSLVVELDPTEVDHLGMAQATLRRGLYADGETIWRFLDPATADLLRSCLVKSSIPKVVAERMKPWLLAITMSVEALNGLGYDEELGLDRHFVLEAKEAGKPIHELETAQEQLEILFGLDEVDGLKFLRASLLEFEALDGQMGQVFLAWRNGDHQALGRILFSVYQENPELAPLLDKLVTGRNLKMMERLGPLMAPGQVPFMVVGATHLLGPRGILEAFRAAGFEVRQL
ncbi:MAG: TraB/GumN family protein [Deltaproteobacteria bacterium]|jgi:uncharacterized protein YbaP (TraB family)|nr:TraB/GumN family protein [Deltaproteobacteria bacterium]